MADQFKDIQLDGDLTAVGDGRALRQFTFGPFGCLSGTIHLSDFTDGGGATGTLAIGTIPTDSMLMQVAHKVPIAVDDDDTNATFVLDLGDGSNADRFIDNANVAAAVSSWVKEDIESIGDGADVGGSPIQLTAATTLTATVTVDVDFTAIDQGAIDLEIWYFTGLSH